MDSPSRTETLRWFNIGTHVICAGSKAATGQINGNEKESNRDRVGGRNGLDADLRHGRRRAIPA